MSIFTKNELKQLDLFGGERFPGITSIADLSRIGWRLLGDVNQNRIRQFVFLNHVATKNYLWPMIINKYGSLESGVDDTLSWLESVGPIETISRQTRKDSEDLEKEFNNAIVPDWYSQYLVCDHFAETKSKASYRWQVLQGSATSCAMNSRHALECWHHSDYGRLGEDDEANYLRPLCNSCHEAIRLRGPSVPASPPEAVKQWI